MKITLLLIDDDAQILETFTHILKETDYTIFTANDGEQGLTLYHHENPDIILLDLHMPGMDGLEVLQRMRTHDPEANVILITGHGDKDAVIEALRGGASDFLSKPIDQVSLESALRRAGERIQLKQKLRASQEALRQQNEQLEEKVRARTIELEREIEERKQLEKALEERQLYLEGVLRAVPDAIITTDVDHKVLEWNQGAERLFGYSHQETVGKELDQLVAGADPQMFDQATGFARKALAGQPVPPTESIRYRKDGTPVNVILTGAPIQVEGKLVGVVAAYMDITQRKEAEEALKESESKLRGILSSMVDHVFAFDSEGRFTFFQTPNADDLYLPPDAFIGKRHSDVMPPYINECFAEAFMENKEGRPAEYEYCLDLDGEIRWFSAKLSPRLVDGAFAGSVAVVRNITERKRMETALQESEERYRTILETIEDGYYEVDIAGNMTFFNPALREILGYPQDALLGMNYRAYMDRETAGEVFQAFNLVYRTGTPTKAFDWKIIQKNGTTRVIESSISLIRGPEGNPAGFQGIVRDVTERKRMEQELKAAVDQLRELDRLKSEFIQNVSHELRSPLGLIRGYAELLDMGELGDLDPMQQQPVAIIARRARMLSALVEDITLLLGTEVNPPAPEPVPLDELARAAVEDFQISAAEAELSLESEIAVGLSPVHGSRTHLRRVLDNLIGNAVKFTPPQGKIIVHVSQPMGDYVLLEVSDTGIGIPLDQQARIFERFYQVDGSSKRRYGGTGLGLALVKEIVETYGGQVSIESKIGEGSTFTITLPAFEQANT